MSNGEKVMRRSERRHAIIQKESKCHGQTLEVAVSVRGTHTPRPLSLEGFSPMAFFVNPAPPVPMTACTVAEGLVKVFTVLPCKDDRVSQLWSWEELWS
jgi:hypothetical protein